MSGLVGAALIYAGLGVEVFPLMPRQKKPYPYTTGLLAASADPELAEKRWCGWAHLPLREPRTPEEVLPPSVRASLNANVAAATGPRSGFWVLDLDGHEAEDALEALVDVHGPLPATPEQITGGGRQILFKWDIRFPLRNSAGKIGPKIDVRGDGGYIVLPPSIHPGDPKRGIPAGRTYHWVDGRSLKDLPLAYAPPWLCRLAMPAEPAPAAASAKPRLGQDGQASRFGEAVLATACRMILTAPMGKRQDTIWGYACQIGGFVGGGEIRQAYALEQLQAAALNMQAGLCDKPDAVRRHVERGLAVGMGHPRTAPELRGFQPAGAPKASPKASPGSAAIEVGEVRKVWDLARPACPIRLARWFARMGLRPDDLPGALARLRMLGQVPTISGPALVLPLVATIPEVDAVLQPEALAFIALNGDGRIGLQLGPRAGKVAVLAAPPEDGALLVALDLIDAWTLGGNAHENGHALGVVLAPTLAAFAGGALGDRFGRVDPVTVHADPDAPAWTAAGDRAVFLAVRNDLRTPELKVRQVYGGTARSRLEGEAAARFYAGLAEQAWRRAGANQVRIMRPPSGQAGFNQLVGAA